MIAFRGTPVREKRPIQRRYECIFFASEFDTAAEYAAAEKAVDDKGYGFVQKYDLGRQRILDSDDLEAREILRAYIGRTPINDDLIMYFEPEQEWIDTITSRGYTGTRLGDDICVFDVRGIRLLGSWRVEWNNARNRWNKQKIA